MNLCDLPIELLTTFIFTDLTAFDLARLCQVNVQLNHAVCRFLADIKTVKMPMYRDFLDMGFGQVDVTAAQRKCFNFMSRHTTNLVSVGEFKRRCDLSWNWIRMPDLLRVVQRNPRLERIELYGVQISHLVLQQLLLCDNLWFVR